MKNKKNKSAFSVIAEAFVSGRNLPKVTPKTYRKISIDEIKEYILEGVKKNKDAKNPEDVHPQEKPGGWGDADLEQHIEWAKSLKLIEFFGKK